jgi:acyl-CoA 6-desaturase (Delta-6 desaturase)
LEYIITRILSFSVLILLNIYFGYSLFESFIIFHLYSLIGTSLLLGTFAVSHTPLDTRDKDVGWVKSAALYTINIDDHWFTNWWMGYLNFQIEHHLFPTMPQFRQPLLAKKYIIPFMKKHNLPYIKLPFWEANINVFKNLRDVAKYKKSI